MSETTENNSRKLSQTSSNGDRGDNDQDELETYTVQDGDNLNKIAAFHDTTPSKLAQLNKLNSRSYVFPGKIMLYFDTHKVWKNEKFTLLKEIFRQIN